MNRRERLTDLSPTRRALLGAGMATLALSLVLSIAPAWAKNTNAGTVKIHDVSTGTDYGDAANDPTVCTFTIVFDFPESQEGTWEIFQQDSGWTSTGLSGAYSTSGVGADETSQMTLDPGHYKVEYREEGSHSSKSKTFWVGDSCGPAGASASASASETPSTEPSTSPSEDPSVSPTATPTATPTEEPTNEAAPTVESSPSDDPSPTATPTATPTEEPTNEAAPTVTPTATPSEAPATEPSGTPEPEGGVEGTTGSSQPTATPPAVAPASDPSTDQLPDTSLGDAVPLTSLLTALGLLMIVAAHPFIRRSAHADRA